MGSAQPTRRELYRTQLRSDVKRLALDQLAERGSAGLSLNAIARELGMSGPALYRYFANRDELLTALIKDAYSDLADSLRGAVEEVAAPTDRVRRLADAYRQWALGNPHRYQLLFGTPIPGYRAPAGETTDSAQRAIQAIFVALGESVGPRTKGRPDPIDRSFETWAREHGWPAMPGRRMRTALTIWTRLHGVLSLELDGHFQLTLPSGELLYESEVADLIGSLAE